MLAAALAVGLSAAPVDPAVLNAVRAVESSHGKDKRDGDIDRPYCQRSFGDWQVTVRAVRHMVGVGRLDAKRIPGFSLTTCGGIVKWLKTRRGGRAAANAYFGWLLSQHSDTEHAAWHWNCGPYREHDGSKGAQRCDRFARKVMENVR
jgi:hypothetical protein